MQKPTWQATRAVRNSILPTRYSLPVTRYLLLVTRFSLLITLLSCSAGKPEPPKIIADRSSCSFCKMLISDTRYAGALNNGQEALYDDLGCMFSAVSKMKSEPEYLWVRDYNTNVWLDARAAVFVYAPKLGTPMNYGYVAVRDASEAAQLAGHIDGRVIGDWNAVVTFFKEKV